WSTPCDAAWFPKRGSPRPGGASTASSPASSGLRSGRRRSPSSAATRTVAWSSRSSTRRSPPPAPIPPPPEPCRTGAPGARVSESSAGSFRLRGPTRTQAIFEGRRRGAPPTLVSRHLPLRLSGLALRGLVLFEDLQAHEGDERAVDLRLRPRRRSQELRHGPILRRLGQKLRLPGLQLHLGEVEDRVGGLHQAVLRGEDPLVARQRIDLLDRALDELGGVNAEADRLVARLLEEGHAVGPLLPGEGRVDDRLHLLRHVVHALGLLEDSHGDQHLAEAAAVALGTPHRLPVLRLGDPPHADQEGAEALGSEVGDGEDRPALLEEDRLLHLAALEEDLAGLAQLPEGADQVGEVVAQSAAADAAV